MHFFSSLLSIQVSNGLWGSISRHFLLFFSITIISGQLCPRFLSVCMGKSHTILQSSDSKTFSGLCMYHFSALLNSHFLTYLLMYQFCNLATSLTCFYSFCVSCEHSGTLCSTVLSATPTGRQMD